MSDTFKTLTRFQYSAEAQIIKGRLEAEGIPVFLADHNTIDTDPLVSNAIGGVKLKVYRKQFNQALEILNQIGDYALDDHGEIITCPKCHGYNIEMFSTVKDLKSFIAFIFKSLTLSVKYRYRCADCNTEFGLQKVI
jgi:DNA-directed RNA polymerase subunit RPC12/RpoP